jgi:hypothetical protein
VIHPPITIENLLPSSASFEIFHATELRELWSGEINSVESRHIHTVSLEEPLLLKINLNYCKCTEGIIIHQPKLAQTDKSIFTNALQKTIEGILEENETNSYSSIILTDAVGQALRLNIENKESRGGHKHIVVYCPYWIVNTTQYSFRIREEGEEDLAAGSYNGDRYVFY